MKKFFEIIICVACLSFFFAIQADAVTYYEVQSEISRVGADTVKGNIFVWFLCAIAFLKVSQKIDSFMSSLGINVGNTGGSMLTEALLAVKGIGMAKGMAGGKVGAGSKSSTGVTSGFKGGLAGMVSRGITKNAVKNANGSKDGGLGGKAFSSSLSKGGGFANKVIGSIANGDIQTMGSISGDNASDSLLSYLGYTALGENAEGVPSFSNVEIGGGRITGNEVSAENPNGLDFAMYSAEKYTAPEGNYTTVTATDGSSWYKQYAVDTVVQRPFVHPDGYIDKGEVIEKRLPKAPGRKDRL